jgi:RNA polymerase sigma-70 factor, ECF subfamily
VGARSSDKQHAPTAVAALEAPAWPSEAPPRSHDDILRGVAAGERWAHVALYDALLPAVLGALQRILRDPSRDYDDLVQTTFERIVRMLVHEKRAPATNLPAWAAAIATHVALDTLRAKIRERRLFSYDAIVADHAGPRTHGNAEDRLEARRQLLSVQGHLARMNRDHAQTLVLHDVLGHDLAETASITGVSVAAAQKRLWRARQELLRRAKRSGGDTR